MEKKIIKSASIKNFNIPTFFHDAFDLEDIIKVNGTLYNAYRINTMASIKVIDIEFDLDKFYEEEDMFCGNGTVRVCGKFTYKFENISDNFANLIDYNKVYEGVITYFSGAYEDIVNNQDFSRVSLETRLDIIENNELFTRTAKIHYSIDLERFLIFTK